jgi:hypothetical protein
MTLALSLLLASGVALADQAPKMPANATPMTARDDCFQTLRGGVDRNALQGGYQVLLMVEASGGTDAQGNATCAGRFKVTTPDGHGRLTPWHSATVGSQR